MAKKINVVQVGVQGPPGAGIGSHEDEDQTLMHVRQVTSSTRPASPIEGQVIYETDTDLFKVWSGTAWIDYQAHTIVPGFRAWQTANQNIPLNTSTDLTGWTIQQDPFGMLDTVTGIATIPTGYDNTFWIVVGSIQWAGHNVTDADTLHGDFRQVEIMYDSGGGFTLVGQTQVSPGDNINGVSACTNIFHCSSGDRVKLRGNQENQGGGGLDTLGGTDDNTIFQMVLVGRAS